MHLYIDKSKCQGHAQCAAMSDGYYDLDDVGFIETESKDVAPGDERFARAGAEVCPERVITLDESASA
jgi:ferredoxin